MDLPNEYPDGSRKMSIIVTVKSPVEQRSEDNTITFRGELYIIQRCKYNELLNACGNKATNLEG